MDAERQQGWAYQLTFDFEGHVGALRHDQGGDDGIRPARPEEPQTSTASDPARALTERLMEEVCRPEDLNRAYRRVKANKGAPGVDGMTIGQLRAWIAAHKEDLLASLLDGS
jgi:RNA-directed DNA polymerase